jgi:hypothetical protein
MLARLLDSHGNTISGEKRAPAMAGPVETVRKMWLAATGQNEPDAPQVTIYDPSARHAHDLDNPFYDENVQIRVAETIAATGNKKTKNSY